MNTEEMNPETKRKYSGVNRFLNSSAFTCVLPMAAGWVVKAPCL